MLQSTFITAASPQFDLHFLPVLIRYKKTNKQNASATSSSLPVSNSYSNQIFAIGNKPCISYILYCTFMPLKNTQYYTRILLHDICLLLPNVSPWSSALKLASYLPIYLLKPANDFWKWLALSLNTFEIFFFTWKTIILWSAVIPKNFSPVNPPIFNRPCSAFL